MYLSKCTRSSIRPIKGWLVVVFHSLLVAFPAYAQNDMHPALSVDWNSTEWTPGARSVHIPFAIPGDDPEEISLHIDVTTRSAGRFYGFGTQSPYIDGSDIVNFGDKLDVGIMFDPDANQGSSPVYITLRFSRPVQYLEFEISDIDMAGGRIDSLVVWGNGGLLRPSLMPLSTDPTVRVSGHTATAIGASSGRARSGSAFGHEDNGNLKVSFGPELLDSVTIQYFEASGGFNPSARGIGVFGELLFLPAKLEPINLLKFGVALDDQCQPVVRWVTNQEFGLSEYLIEYSYDGFNFFETASVSALNQYTSETSYEIPLYRKLNTDNYFRLVKVDGKGDKEILTSQVLNGSECFQFTSVNVYPNPSSANFVFVEIEATSEKQTDIAIIDQYGEILVQTSYQLKRGQNIFKLASRHLVPGVYSLRFSIDGEMVTKRVSIVD
ncbi:MAG: T9SS type A sorting domain-containing protein [Saprospiraceae bacterium]|nr:T9SS type A sorting domain-containing protein [Saprospiraceae bacterium]